MAIKREAPQWRQSPRDKESFVLRYPLHEWFDEGVWELKEGVDFTGSLKQFRQSLYYHAKEGFQKLRTKIERRDGHTYLIIQAYPMTGDELAREQAKNRL